MNHRCVEPLELAALLALPADDPRRRDAAACPRCDSLLLEMAAFLEGEQGPPDAVRAHAEQHLAAVLAGAMASRSERTTGAATSAVREPTVHRSRRGRGWGWGLGLAAAAAAVVILVTGEPLAPSGPSGVLRGGPGSAPVAGALTITVEADDRAGKLLVSWTAVAGADRYQVELFSAELDTLAVLGPVTGSSLVVDVVDPAAGVLCRVRALGPAGQVAVSRLTGLKRP